MHATQCGSDTNMLSPPKKYHFLILRFERLGKSTMIQHSPLQAIWLMAKSPKRVQISIDVYDHSDIVISRFSCGVGDQQTLCILCRATSVPFRTSSASPFINIRKSFGRHRLDIGWTAHLHWHAPLSRDLSDLKACNVIRKWLLLDSFG